MSRGIMPRRKLTFIEQNGRIRVKMMTAQEAFESDREELGTVAALDNWFERRQPVWLLISRGNKG
jgi:hypothetical protein